MNDHRTPQAAQIVEYRRLGGFIGEESTLVVGPGTRVEFQKKISGKPTPDIVSKLNPGEFARLENCLDNKDLLSFDNVDVSEESVRDGYSFSITFRRQKQVKTIVFQELDDNVPEILLELRRQLDGVIARLELEAAQS